jgi:DNA-binding response OmpR family regulator
MSSARRLLLAVATTPLREALAGEVVRAGWQATPLATVEAVAAAAPDHDLLLLDGDLGEEAALALCRSLRALGLTQGIILLLPGNRATLLGRRALEAGADECLARPFRAGHLAARLEAIHARRAGEQAREAGVQLGSWTFRLSAKQLVDASGRTVRLTEKEATLLHHLHRAFPAPVARETLLADVWGYGSGIDTHTLQTHIYRLRRKIAATNPAAPLILSAEGGYRLAEG